MIANCIGIYIDPKYKRPRPKVINVSKNQMQPKPTSKAPEGDKELTLAKSDFEEGTQDYRE